MILLRLYFQVLSSAGPCFKKSGNIVLKEPRMARVLTLNHNNNKHVFTLLV